MCSAICFEVGPSQCSARSRLVHLFVVDDGLLYGHVVACVLNVHLIVQFLKKSLWFWMCAVYELYPSCSFLVFCKTVCRLFFYLHCG